MDFGLNRTQEMLKNMVNEFARRELIPNALRWDDSGEYPLEIVPKMGQLKLFGTSVDAKYGGNSLGHVAAVIITEELSWGHTPIALTFLNIEECAWILDCFASEELKERFIPAMCEGKKISCFAATEQAGGSDMASLQSTAEDNNDGYVINGRKVFISLGDVADFCLFNARYDDGISLFIVEKGTPGFEVTRRERMWGLGCYPVNELTFSNCTLPKSHMVGDPGSGVSIFLQALVTHARPAAGAVTVGLARSAFETAVKFAKERKLRGTALGDFQAIQMMLADMDTEIHAARWLNYHCAWLLDQGKGSRELVRESGRAKLYGVEMANRVCHKAVQILGGYGVSLDYPTIRRLNDAISMIPASGSHEVMRMLIAQELLK